MTELAQGAVTTNSPTYTTGTTDRLSLTTSGFLRTAAGILAFNGVPMDTSTAAAQTAPGRALNTGGVYLSTKPALTNGQSIGTQIDSAGSALTASGGSSRSLNIIASVNVKSGVGRLYRVVLNTAGSTATSIIDSTGTSATAANTILTIPSTAAAGTVFVLEWPFATGLSVVPGTSAVLAVSYD